MNSLSEYTEVSKDLKFLLDVAEKIKIYKTLPKTMEVPNTLIEYKQVKEDYGSLLIATEADNFKVDKNIEITGETLATYFNLVKDLIDIEKGARASKIEIGTECVRDRSNTLNEYVELAKDVTSIIQCYKKCKELSIKGKALNDRIAEIEKQLKEYKVCPLCGHELNRELVEC